MGQIGQTHDQRALKQDTRWADGLRGIAAVGVVSSHICLSFWQQLITPCINGTDGPSLLFQRPILRLVIQGQSFVALFFILMGFVNSLKPLKQAQSGQIEDALLTLARSALNRSARLLLPAVAVTFLAWLACQLHLYEIARRSEAYWLEHTSIEAESTWIDAIFSLVDALISTWVWGENPYDQPQWALKWLLLGSFWIFCVLLITITTRPAFRISILAIAYIYSWISADFILGTNIYFGILLGQLHTLSTTLSSPLSLTWTRRILPFLSAFLGLYLMSFPSSFAPDAAWSRSLLSLSSTLTPSSTDPSRFYASLGAQLLTLSILLSPPLQHLCSAAWACRIGDLSFSLYLLHGPLMRILLAPMVFGFYALSSTVVTAKDGTETYPMPPKWTLVFVLPVFATMLMACVHLWASRVEPLFARATRAVEMLARGSAGDPIRNLPLSAGDGGKR